MIMIYITNYPLDISVRRFSSYDHEKVTLLNKRKTVLSAYKRILDVNNNNKGKIIDDKQKKKRPIRC